MKGHINRQNLEHSSLNKSREKIEFDELESNWNQSSQGSEPLYGQSTFSDVRFNLDVDGGQLDTHINSASTILSRRENSRLQFYKISPVRSSITFILLVGTIAAGMGRSIYASRVSNSELYKDCMEAFSQDQHFCFSKIAEDLSNKDFWAKTDYSLSNSYYTVICLFSLAALISGAEISTVAYYTYRKPIIDVCNIVHPAVNIANPSLKLLNILRQIDVQDKLIESIERRKNRVAKHVSIASLGMGSIYLILCTSIGYAYFNHIQTTDTFSGCHQHGYSDSYCETYALKYGTPAESFFSTMYADVLKSVGLLALFGTVSISKHTKVFSQIGSGATNCCNSIYTSIKSCVNRRNAQPEEKERLIDNEIK